MLKYIKILIINCIAILILLSLDFVQAKAAEITTPKVKLSFGVISDVHIKDEQTIEDDKFEKALKTMSAEGIDTFLVAGDLTDSGTTRQYDKFNVIYKKNSKSTSKLLAVLGNHDYWNDLPPQDSQKRFEEKMNLKVNSHEVISGFHFIQVSTEAAPSPGVFSQSTVEWVKKQLEIAKNDDPNKPIFFTVHQHIANTVYGSDLWGNSTFKNILKNYPQVIAFSGHSHYPISDERSINQEDFTSIGTSSLSYIEMEDGIPPNGADFSQGLIVNVYDDNKVEVKRRDFHNDEWIKKYWVIENPVDRSKFVYTNDRINYRNKPYFSKDSVIDVSNITENSLAITFSQGKHDDFVHSYKIEVINKQTSNVEQKINMVSDFYLGINKIKPTLTTEVSNLAPGTEYDIKITAIESFGLESDSKLITSFKTIPSEAQNIDKSKTEVFNYNFISGYIDDTILKFLLAKSK